MFLQFTALLLSLIFCMPTAQAADKALLGALIGAGAGAAIGHSVKRGGGAGTGALIGAVGGYVIGNQMDKSAEQQAQPPASPAQSASIPPATANCGRANDLLDQADRSRDNDTKIYLLEKASSLCPDYARIHNDLGVAYYQRNGRFDRDRARDEFNSALRINPDYQIARDNLARL